LELAMSTADIGSPASAGKVSAMRAILADPGAWKSTI
jgi:hypothetical protein